MDGRTQGRTHTRTHGQRETSIPTTNKVCWGYKYGISYEQLGTVYLHVISGEYLKIMILKCSKISNTFLFLFSNKCWSSGLGFVKACK